MTKSLETVILDVKFQFNLRKIIQDQKKSSKKNFSFNFGNKPLKNNNERKKNREKKSNCNYCFFSI